jgi:hypothetical protein
MARCIDEEQYKALVKAAQDAIALLETGDPTVEESQYVRGELDAALRALGERVWRY